MTRRTPRRARFDIDDSHTDDVVVVAPRGPLDESTYHLLRDHLARVSTEHPRAVVIDLDGMEVFSPGALALFSSAYNRLAVWPGVPLLLAAGTEQTRRLVADAHTARYVPVRENVLAAIAAIDDPPPRRVANLPLPNELTSPQIARRFTRRRCAEWDVPRVSDDATIVTDVLVTNAVVHTRSPLDLHVELRRGSMSVAVYDAEPGTVLVRDPGGRSDHIHGMLLVAQVSSAWGCSPTSSGGKVVWATLRTGPGNYGG